MSYNDSYDKKDTLSFTDGNFINVVGQIATIGDDSIYLPSVKNLKCKRGKRNNLIMYIKHSKGTTKFDANDRNKAFEARVLSSIIQRYMIK